ncbi:MAG: hypothetical protein WCA00_06760 [Candidatus Acidiferrales bacterium]
MGLVRQAALQAAAAQPTTQLLAFFRVLSMWLRLASHRFRSFVNGNKDCDWEE